MADTTPQQHADAIESRDATIAELRAQVEALRADAERYRWLRDRQEPGSAAADEDAEFRHGSISRIFVGTGLGHAVAHIGAELDSAIDTARSQEDKR